MKAWFQKDSIFMAASDDDCDVYSALLDAVKHSAICAHLLIAEGCYSHFQSKPLKELEC